MAPSLQETDLPQKPTCTMLRVHGTNIVNASGQVVVLKGAGLGGHLNMENFATGFSGHEHEHRAAMREAMGAERADFFFDRLLHHFFTDADAAFFASLGLNCVRVPFNYRHFEDDMEPGVYKEDGFARLDAVVRICARHGLYVILDMHAVPGGQNQDWHSDSGLSRALFWEFRHFQDRAVALWCEIARRYRGNPHVAGYNPLNEPADPLHTRLTAWYVRAEKAIRAVDPEHILFIDGNTYAMDFSRFPEEVLPNAVYSCHDYSLWGFPIGEDYEGTEVQRKELRRAFEAKVEFMRRKGVPIWNGEFGPVYADPRIDADAEKVNRCRVELVREQLRIYREAGASWSIWLYKDIGYQGMVYVDPESAYMRLIAPFVAKKQGLGLDFWGRSMDGSRDVYAPFIKKLEGMVRPDFRARKYPDVWTFERQVQRVLLECLMSEYVGWEMAELFRGKSEEELEELARSFALENCKMRDELNEVLAGDV